MQNLSKSLVVFAILAIFLTSIYADTEKIQAAAQAGLQKYLKLIPNEMIGQYGFENPAQLHSCKLGAALQLHVIPPQNLQKYSVGATVKSLVQNTGVWYFPVTCAGDSKAMLIVAKMENKWQAVSFGYAPLAKQMQSIQKSWPQQRGYDPMLVVVYQARQYLFHVPELDSQNLTAISTNPQDRAVNYLHTQSLQTVVPSLWKEAQKNIRAQQQFEK